MTFIRIYDGTAAARQQHFQNVIGLSHAFGLHPAAAAVGQPTNIIHLVSEQLGDTWLPTNQVTWFPRMIREFNVIACQAAVVGPPANPGFLYAICADKAELDRVQV